MIGKVICLKVGGLNVAPEVRNCLASICQRMLKERTERFDFEIEDVDLAGSVETQFQYGLIGFIGGIVFKAITESPRGTCQMKFILDESAVEDKVWNRSVWIPRKALPERSFEPSMN